MAEEAHSAYAQLLSVGLLWISFHCAGMCGPLLIGFDVAGAARGVPAWRGGLAILTYQGGRALVYALLGALAGLFGAGLERALTDAGAVFALALGALALSGAVWRYLPRRPAPLSLERRAAGAPAAGPLDGVAARLRRLVLPLAGARGALSHLSLGALMGLLPCMITYWVLGLAATTRSPIHGAGLMILLVLMTTPMLLGVTLLPRLFVGRLGRLGRHLPAVLMTLSGGWLTMVGLAGLEVVAHLHVNFALFGEPLTVMLW